jgi:3-deoxy-7-phosphoheptulonate synthase
MRHAITGPAPELAAHGVDLGVAARVHRRYPVRLTPYALSLLRAGDPPDPLALQGLPAAAELLDEPGMTADPFHETTQAACCHGLKQRFPDRVLVMAHDQCAMACRHCTRKGLLGAADVVRTPSQVTQAVAWVRAHPQVREVHVSEGKYKTIIGLIGDTSKVDIELLESLSIIESVKRISEPFKNANRKFHTEDSVVDVGGVKIGGGNFQIIAGPCSVETREQIITVAKSVKASGATLLRGGAFKPRTSPYDFQGLKADGIELLLEAKAETGLPIVSEIMNINDLELFRDVDLIQVGARNMQNFDLLKALGRTDKPVLLKRGLANNLKELLMSAEYIMAGGNERVILCERGIRTFETYTRNTLDLSAVPMLHELTHLPVIVDPSHATGLSRLVESMSLAAAASGADGLMIEVHNDPEHALCDGAQSLTPEAFDRVAKRARKIREALA